MKLASLVAMLLLSTSSASADDRVPINPFAEPAPHAHPGAPIDPFAHPAPHARPSAPIDPFAHPAPRARVPLDPFAESARPRAAIDPFAESARPRPDHHRKQLRRALLQRFDRNGDGKLQPRERKQAARALRKLAKRIQRGKPNHVRRSKLIRRFDRDHDGNLGPGELPPVIADELRPLDRNGDGWLHSDELP